MQQRFSIICRGLDSQASSLRILVPRASISVCGAEGIACARLQDSEILGRGAGGNLDLWLFPTPAQVFTGEKGGVPAAHATSHLSTVDGSGLIKPVEVIESGQSP